MQLLNRANNLFVCTCALPAGVGMGVVGWWVVEVSLCVYVCERVYVWCVRVRVRVRVRVCVCEPVSKEVWQP